MPPHCCPVRLPHGADPSDHGDGRAGGRASGRPDHRGRRTGRAPAPGAGGAGHRLGEVGGLLGGHRRSARGRGRADAGGLTAAGPDARSDRRRGSGRAARRHGQLDQRRRVGRGARRRTRRPDRRAADLAGATVQPVLRPAAARPARRRRPAGHRRGPLRLRLGLRLPARLPAADPDPALPGPGHAGAGHHRDRQPAGDRRRGRPARRRHRHPARLAGAGLAPARRGPRAERARAVRLDRRRADRPCPAPASSTC